MRAEPWEGRSKGQLITDQLRSITPLKRMNTNMEEICKWSNEGNRQKCPSKKFDKMS